MSPRRKFNGPTNRNLAPQHTKTAARLIFEREARSQFPGLQRVAVPGGFQYVVTLSVPHYEARRVRIRFRANSDVPVVLADGPDDSPHRYGDGRLCMWYPDDPVENRWVFEDGLLALIGLVIAHLFREAWWWETGEWVGEEVPHSPQAKE